ncbi:13648_t:CDS:1, partial [Dentiscutata heterogama]
PTKHTTFNTNKHITNISENNNFLDYHTTFDTDKLIDKHTTFDANTPAYNKIESLLYKNLKESDLENNTYSLDRRLNKLDNKNDKYESNKFLLKLYIKDENNTTLPAKQLNILANSCNEFHSQILSNI